MGRRLIFLLVVSLFVTSCAQREDSPNKTSKVEQTTYTSADVKQALDDAERFTREGNYEQALERHIWYHENALKYAPSQYGVRLSFALSDWVELGKSYPKALDALRHTRDEALATYRRDPTDSLNFGEVMSIDFALDDLQSAKSLFYEGRKNGVNQSLLPQVDRIVAAGELTWASDAIGDPSRKLEEIRSQREMLASTLRDHPDNAIDLNNMYSKQIAGLVKTVAKVKGLPAALDLQKKALKILDSPEIRNALKD